MARKPRGKPLSVDGINSVRDALAKQGWTQETWANRAHVSASTIGRLLRGHSMDAGTLESALSVLDLEVSDCTVVRQNDALAPTVFAQSAQQPGIYMTATFDKAKRPQIDIILRHLSSLLIGCSIKYFKGDDGVRVFGEFEEHQRKEIEAALQDLEEECITCHVTWQLPIMPYPTAAVRR